jgi:hypothetical protein
VSSGRSRQLRSARHGRAHSQFAIRRYSAMVDARSFRSRSLCAMNSSRARRSVRRSSESEVAYSSRNRCAAASACAVVRKLAGGRLAFSHALPSVLRESLPLGSR